MLEKDERFELVDVQPDVAVVLGDRVEMLGAATTWAERRVRLVHLHGGEHTYGSLDERWRWAISAIADVHCVAHSLAASELRAFLSSISETRPGMEKRVPAVHVTGAPGIDGILARKTIAVAHPFVMVAYNPVIDRDTTLAESAAIAAALLPEWNVLRVGPNGDRYSDVLGPGIEVPSDRYRDFLANADVIVGNSSAGIIEAPSFGTWAVNVGDRQRGRLRGPNVIDVGASATDIQWAISSALRRGRARRENPYNADGRACERIRDVLLGMAT